MKGDRFYAVVRGIGRFWLWFFFKDIDVVRADLVPASGPVLLCINHPNNLIDSLLVGGVLPRKVHYLATAALFRNPLVARFLAACGAIPVYRKQDDPGKMDRNADAFAACFRALEGGRLVGIYPEGTTHSESRVQRIRTGAARIALDYQAAGRGAPLVLIPLWQAIHGTPRGERIVFGIAIALYVVAKVAEINDHAIFGALGFVSGHTLKHLLAAAGAAMIAVALARRSAAPPGYHLP